MGGVATACTISGHRRTRVFEFPGAYAILDGNEAHYPIFESASMGACVVSNLVDYFANAAFSDHYAISPSLRHAADEVSQKAKRAHGTQLFVVIEEIDELAPVEMNLGECSLCDEVIIEDGEPVPVLVGGRVGKKFIAAWATLDGAWPELPGDQRLVNLVMAGVRASQQFAGPIPKHLDQRCLVTDDGRFVDILRPSLGAATPTTASPLNAAGCAERATRIRNGIEGINRDLGDARVELLVRSMYCDDAGDEAFQQLLYLHLWQSAIDTDGVLCRRAQLENDDEAIAGHKTPRELKKYRNDIAHGRTDGIDASCLAGLQHTVNALICDKYFRPGPGSNPKN